MITCHCRRPYSNTLEEKKKFIFDDKFWHKSTSTSDFSPELGSEWDASNAHLNQMSIGTKNAFTQTSFNVNA